MGDNVDKVFVEMSGSYYSGMPILEWTLNHFDKDKTKIILTNFRSPNDVYYFRHTTQRKYLLRCKHKKFRAETLIPNAVGQVEASIVELITKHGMNKFVREDRYDSATSKIFKAAPNLSCKIWFVNALEGNLASTRCYNDGNDEIREETSQCEQEDNGCEEKTSQSEQEANKCEVEYSQSEQESNGCEEEASQSEQEANGYEEETSQSEEEEETRGRNNVEKEFLPTIEQAKINERLRQEIDQLKLHKALSTSSSGEGGSGVSEGYLVATDGNADTTPIFYDCED